MNLEMLKRRLDDSGVLTVNERTFIHSMPDTIETGVLLLDSSSGTRLDMYLPDLKRDGFQVIVRHREYKDCKRLARSVNDELTFERLNIDNIYYWWVRPRNEPITFPVSKGSFVEFSTNYDTVYCE